MQPLEQVTGKNTRLLKVNRILLYRHHTFLFFPILKLFILTLFLASTGNILDQLFTSSINESTQMPKFYKYLTKPKSELLCLQTVDKLFTCLQITYYNSIAIASASLSIMQALQLRNYSLAALTIANHSSQFNHLLFICTLVQLLFNVGIQNNA